MLIRETNQYGSIKSRCITIYWNYKRFYKYSSNFRSMRRKQRYTNPMDMRRGRLFNQGRSHEEHVYQSQIGPNKLSRDINIIWAFAAFHCLIRKHLQNLVTYVYSHFRPKYIIRCLLYFPHILPFLQIPKAVIALAGCIFTCIWLLFKDELYFGLYWNSLNILF